MTKIVTRITEECGPEWPAHINWGIIPGLENGTIDVLLTPIDDVGEEILKRRKAGGTA